MSAVANPREMAAKLRRPHTPQCRMYYATGGSYDPKHDGKCDPWKCGAEDFNAQVDALLAAIDEEMRHADRLAEALSNGEWHSPEDCRTEKRTRVCNACKVLSAHRARRGGQ